MNIRGQLGTALGDSLAKKVELEDVCSGSKADVCYGAGMLNVECSESLAGVLEPRIILFGSRRVDVRAIIDRWYGTGRQWLKVETDEGAYVLRLDEATATWQLAAVVGR